MESFDTRQYGPHCEELLQGDRMCDLGPGAARQSARARLQALTVDDVFAGQPIRDREMAEACLGRRTGGALLGDRIRMNTLRSERVFMRSIATRRQHLATSEMLGDQILFLKSLGFDLIIVETAGIVE